MPTSFQPPKRKPGRTGSSEGLNVSISEPTGTSSTLSVVAICLDAISKKAVREFITKINKQQNVTVILTTHDMADIEALAKEIKGAKRYFLQNFVDSGDLIGENLSAHEREVLEAMKCEAEKTLDIVEIRGI